MITKLLPTLVFLAAIGSGVVGGVFFAFSNFVMAALAHLAPAEGIHAMQAINVTVLNRTYTVLTATNVNGGVSGNVPATLSLTLGTPAQFGAFTPGVTRTYLASTSANVISTAGDALLSVADPSSTATGRLVNGAFSLPQVLQVNAGGAFAPVGGSAAPTALKSWTAPTSNESVQINFRQTIGANDALRTGTYSKTLTFTLSTTTP